MNRNVESHFSLAPNVNIPRSIMDRSFSHKSSGNVGRLIPMYYQEVLPGQTTRVVTNAVIRMQPMVSSPLDDLYLDTYYFFVPNRLVWNHWKEFMGENTSAPWVQTTEYTIPQLSVSNSQDETNFFIHKNSILDYFGIPRNGISPGGTLSFSALPFRAYALIVREFFQDQNLETPVNVPLDDSSRAFATTYYQTVDTLDNNYVTYLSLGGFPYNVNKYHDYFTSCTPGPTKSVNDVLAFPNLPVVFDPTVNEQEVFDRYYNPLIGPTGQTSSLYGKYVTESTTSDVLEISDDAIPVWSITDGSAQGYGYPLQLQAKSGITINDLRSAFMVQRLLERDLFGTRYREMLKAHFGVTSPDASMQVPQYLGGKRQMLRISQILQTSETATTPQGNVAGYSLTADSDYSFEQSFTEHGMIIGLMAVRYKNSYQNGLSKLFTRKTRFDYYFPELAGLGNMPVRKGELFADGSTTDKEIFGYQEAWAEYRYHPDMITGEMRSGISNTLDSWHFGDYYTSHPTLSRDWMKVDKSNVDRVLAVQSSVSNQFWFDILFDEKTTLPMPLYSIPGLGSNF